jgi:hypothetical protein
MPPVWAARMVAPPLDKRAAVIRGEGGAVRHAGGWIAIAAAQVNLDRPAASPKDIVDSARAALDGACGVVQRRGRTCVCWRFQLH